MRVAFHFRLIFALPYYLVVHIDRFKFFIVLCDCEQIFEFENSGMMKWMDGNGVSNGVVSVWNESNHVLGETSSSIVIDGVQW